jgi:hypothetical protein
MESIFKIGNSFLNREIFVMTLALGSRPRLGQSKDKIGKE